MEPAGTERARKTIKIAIYSLLLLLVGGGAIVVGLPLSLFSGSLAHEYQGQDVAVAQALMPPSVSTISSTSMANACRPNDMPYLGLTYLPITEATARYYGFQEAKGLLITAVANNSPAARAGLKVNDVLLEFDNYALGPNSSLVNVLMSYKIGDNVPLVLSRQNERKEVELTLSKRPGD